MKLWLLRPVHCESGDVYPESGLWKPWYDKAFGFVVRAETEEHARQYAQDNAGEEIRVWKTRPTYKLIDRNAPAWTSPEHSTCVELSASGDAGLILRDFAAA